MGILIVPTLLPAQIVFSVFLTCSVIVWALTFGAREVFAYARTVTRQKAVKAAAVAVVIAVVLAYATTSEATVIIRCDWPCWWY